VELFDDLVRANQAYVAQGAHRSLPVKPTRGLAIVTCMDSRIDAFASLGLDLGDAHVVRVAGARVTSDVLRSLALSHHALDTRSVAVIGHTDCGLSDPAGDLPDRLAALMRHPPEARDWHTFRDVRQAVREDCELLLRWPDRPQGLTLAGYVLDIMDGRLEEVVAPIVAAGP
jgi:carbonic anhydrase